MQAITRAERTKIRRAAAQPAGRPLVLCLHSSASSGRQWRRLGEDQPDLDVLAPDLPGYGGRSWQPATRHDLADEVAAVGRLIEARGEAVHLIGHSYGGAVATHVALEMPERIRTLTLFEPVLFPLLYSAMEESGREIWLLQTDVRRLVKQGRPRDAAERFVDYWNRAGAFRDLSERAQDQVTAVMPKVAAEFTALIATPITECDLQRLGMPTLLLYGEQSPASTRDIVRLMAEALPSWQLIRFHGMGHMGPVEDPERVNAAVAGFIRGQAPELVPGACGSGGR